MKKYLIGKDWQTLLLAEHLAFKDPGSEIQILLPEGMPIPWGMSLADVASKGKELQGHLLIDDQDISLPLKT